LGILSTNANSICSFLQKREQKKKKKKKKGEKKKTFSCTENTMGRRKPPQAQIDP
jgi:hypothetical protein